MGVYRRKDSSSNWWISYCVSGKLYREAGGSTKAQAVALLAKRKVEVYDGQHFPDKKRLNLTVSALRDLWLSHAVNKRSFAADKRRFEAIVDHFGASTQLTGIRPADIERFQGMMAVRITRRKRPTAPATVNRHLALLRAALRYAVNNQYLHRNPMVGIKMLAEHNQRDRICSPEEYALLCAGANPKLKLAIVIGFFTGMRLGEITGLGWKDIDLQRRVVCLQPGTTKSGHGRLIPLGPEVVTALAGEARRLDGRLFDVDRRTLSPAFARLCRKLGVLGLRFHDLRHTAATRLRRGGADLFTIAAITGHKDLASLRRYNTITLDDMHKALIQASGAVVCKVTDAPI